MTLPVGDNFNRADASPIGGNWSTVAGLASTALVSNASTASSNLSDSVSYWNAETFPVNQYSKAKIAVIVGSADIGITARCATNFYLSISRVTGSDILKYTGGGFSLLASITHAVYANGDVIGIECEGTTIRSLKNGISQGSTTDSAVTSGAPGVYHWFTAARLDDWEGGSLLGNVSKRYNNKTRNLNKQGFRSNVLLRGKLGWRETVYRHPDPQATNPSTVNTHATTGVLTGQGSIIVGSAAHKAKHTTTGVLTGQGSSIVGAAAHKVKHPTSGVLTGQGSSIVGAAAHKVKHPTSGVLTGQGSSVVGAAAHKAKHTTTGVLAGLVSTIAGAARRFITHSTTGALTGQGSTIVGSSAHKAKHTTTGVLTGPGSITVGAARRFITHVTSGVLTGQGSSVVGSASRATGSGAHVTTGTLTGQSSSIVGAAAHKAKHTTTGVLTGQASSIAGTSQHKAKHTTTGALIGQSSGIVGTAVHKVLHATTGALIGLGAIIIGASVNGTSVITKRFGVAYWKPVEKDEPIEPIQEEDVEVWTEPDLFEKLKETRANHEAIVRKAQQVELMEEQQRIRLRKAQDNQIIEIYLRSKR